MVRFLFEPLRSREGGVATIKSIDALFLDKMLEMESGYVLNFSDRTFSTFFAEDLSIDIDDPMYSTWGTSKAKRLRAFLSKAEPQNAARALRALWRYREDLRGPAAARDESRFSEIAGPLEGNSNIAKTDAIDRFAEDPTLEELIAAIERDIQAAKPQAALDRLHTYCMKKFAHLLTQRGVSCTQDEPLHSRAGKYIKAIKAEGKVHDISLAILQRSITFFSDYNDVRNHKSLAHDNAIMEAAEGRFVFDSVVSLLRFIKAVETSRFGA